MATRDFVDYLEDILDGIEKVEQFTRGADFEDFSSDDKTKFAVIRALEIIGEASRLVPRSVRVKYESIPWQDMADMRNKLIHEYFGVDIAVVWKNVQ